MDHTVWSIICGINQSTPVHWTFDLKCQKIEMNKLWVRIQYQGSTGKASQRLILNPFFELGKSHF